MKTKILRGFFLLSVMTFCMSACQDDAEIILFSGSQLINESGTCTNTISSTTLYLNGQGTKDMGIANGKGGYSAHSSDETIVTATVSNDRLLINSHGKKGKVAVTVSDKKGNSVVLPVTVSYGVISLFCKEQTGFAVCVDDELLSMEKEEDKELLESVNEVMMQKYSFIKGREVCILQPDDVSNFMADGSGSFILKTEKGEIRAEGTYQVGHDDDLISDKQCATFTFSYKGADNVDRQHQFYLNPPFKRQPSTKSIGPTMIYWMEDVTDSSYLTECSLPENGKVFYVVYTSSFGVRPTE